MITVNSRILRMSDGAVLTVRGILYVAQLVDLATPSGEMIRRSLQELRQGFKHLDDRTGAHLAIDITEPPSKTDPLTICDIHTCNDVSIVRRYITEYRGSRGANYLGYRVKSRPLNRDPMFRFTESTTEHHEGIVFDVCAKWQGSKDGWLRVASVTRYILGDKKGTLEYSPVDPESIKSAAARVKRSDARWKVGGQAKVLEYQSDAANLQSSAIWILAPLCDASTESIDKIDISLWCRSSQ